MTNQDPTSAACLFLLFILPTTVSPRCWKAVVNKCMRAEFVPGYNYSSGGFNILKLTTPLSNWTDADQWQTPEGGCTLCENPLLEGKPLQKLPLTITDWRANISCEQKVQHSVHLSGISVAEALTGLQVKSDWWKKLDVNITITSGKRIRWTLAGSRSTMAQSCIWKSSRDKYIFFLHHITCSYYKFRVRKDQLLTAHFEQEVNRLPEKYGHSSDTEYYDFIAAYGTHVGTEVDLGVHVRFLTAVPVCKAGLDGINLSELSRCQAIELGIAFGLDEVTYSSDFHMCEERKKNPNFLLLLSERREERWGSGLPFNTSKDWLESAKSWPALLYSSLEPIHTLVDKANPRRESLRQAVSEHVQENFLWRNCHKSCPPGSKLSTSDLCSCECPNNAFTNSMCCAQKRGLAKLTVTIQGANNLWGDYISLSDAYVSVTFQKKRICTRTVWNNNSPTWNVSLFFGVVQLHQQDNKLQVEVWDEDNGWNDDFLGKCDHDMKSWIYEPQKCYLDHGHVHFKYHLACAPNLGGPFCWDYISQPPNKATYYK